MSSDSNKVFWSPVAVFGIFGSLIQELISMKHLPLLSLFLVFSAATLPAQIPIPRANAEIDAAGVSPVGGYLANAYSSGPGLRAGGDFRVTKYLAADAGWTGAWMSLDNGCKYPPCSYPQLENKFLDYGLRGVLPLAGGRVEFSVGVGGGYIWFDRTSGDSYHNGTLFQYSGKAAVALDRSGHWRVNLTVRTWRDLGSPIQQWLSTAAGISYGFGTVR
jgi:hypothetical protein